MLACVHQGRRWQCWVPLPCLRREAGIDFSPQERESSWLDCGWLPIRDGESSMAGTTLLRKRLPLCTLLHGHRVTESQAGGG